MMLEQEGFWRKLFFVYTSVEISVTFTPKLEISNKLTHNLDLYLFHPLKTITNV